MSKDRNPTGGCQCGAVRFRITTCLGAASICHCRMCQKAFGGFFGPLVSAVDGGILWTRGAPTHFVSSNFVQRGFCKDCGTPLTFEHGDDGIEIAIGALDDPGVVAPASQLAHNTAVPYFDQLHTLRERDVTDGAANKGSGEKLVSYQHPDYDTDNWPPASWLTRETPSKENQ